MVATYLHKMFKIVATSPLTWLPKEYKQKCRDAWLKSDEFNLSLAALESTTSFELRLKEPGDMSGKELKNIYKLTNSLRRVLDDEEARNLLENFTKSEELGINETYDHIQTYKLCALMKIEKDTGLTERNVNKLLVKGLPYELDVQLRKAVNTSDGDNILNRIQQHCISEIETLKEFDNFRKYLLKRIA